MEGAPLPYDIGKFPGNTGPSASSPYIGVGPISDPRLPEGTPSHWLTYVMVGNANEAAEKVKKNGGVVVNGPMDTANGKILIIAGPDGEIVGAAGS
jgi:predicted enzyme related to lactoylglutathione lyase